MRRLTKEESGLVQYLLVYVSILIILDVAVYRVSVLFPLISVDVEIIYNSSLLEGTFADICVNFINSLMLVHTIPGTADGELIYHFPMCMQ